MVDWRSDDRELLARILTAEAGNQGPVGMLAAGNVIMNRANTTGYGDGIRGVIMKPGQFSPMNSVTGYAGGEQGQNIDALTPSETAYMVADNLMSGSAEDITGGATHFYNPDISQPSWAQGRDFIRIGDHVFGRADAKRGATPNTRVSTMNQPTQSQPSDRPRGLRGLLSDPDLFDRLAIGFGGMTLNPNTALMQMAADRIAGRREDRQTTQTKNRTAEWLRSRGRDDLADAVMSGAIGGREAASIAYQQPEERGQILSADQMRQIFPGTQIEDGLYNLRPDGTANKVGGGGNVINMPAPESAESKLFEALNKDLGEQFAGFLTAGANSAVAVQDLNVLQELATLSPSGPLEGRFAEMFPEFSDVAAVRQSIITRVAPTLRVEGSGSTSDLEYNGMLRSLGSLRNNPEANQAIISLMQDKARFNVARANIVRELQSGRITVDAANQQIAELERSLAIPQQVQNVLRLGESGSLGDAAAEIESLIR